MAHTAEITFKEFRRRYNSEDACRAELFRLCFPKGFVCPKHMVKKYPDFERGESASETGRTHIPPRLFKGRSDFFPYIAADTLMFRSFRLRVYPWKPFRA